MLSFLFIIFLYNGIVHRNPKEEAISTLNNTDNSHTHNAEQKSQAKKFTLHYSTVKVYELEYSLLHEQLEHNPSVIWLLPTQIVTDHLNPFTWGPRCYGKI